MIAIGATMLSHDAAATEPWPTQHFEISFSKPSPPKGNESPESLASAPLTDAQYEAIAISPAQILALENYLHDSAELLMKWGFPPPQLGLHPPVTTKNAGVSQVYRIYAYPFIKEGDIDADDEGIYFGECDDDDPTFEYIILNTREWVDATGAEDPADAAMSRPRLHEAMFIAGHELFHAVQDATVAETLDCENSTPDWMTEGTADAIGYDLFRLIKGQQKIEHPHGAPSELHGLRNYGISLEIKTLGDEDMKYNSASFWRYLAERNYAVVNQEEDLPGAGWEEPDYSYLATLYGDPNHQNDDYSPARQTKFVKWLSEALRDKTKIGVGLDRILPDFYAVFADFPAQRARPAKPGRWLNAQCGYEVEAQFNANGVLMIDGENRRDSFTDTIDPRANTCFIVNRDAELLAKTLSITITANTQTKAKALDLSLGEAGGRNVEHDTKNGGCDATGRCKNTWYWTLEPNQPKVFVLTAARPNAPELTETNKVTVTVSTGGVENNLSNPPSEGIPTNANPGDEPPTPREALERDALRLTNDGVFTGSVSRPDDDDGAMVIGLGTTVGYADIVGSVNGVGGTVQQAMSTSTLVGENLPMLMAAEMRLEQDSESRDGAQIEIRFPKIDYGFTGPINNVLITSSRSGGRTMFTAGPRDIDPDIAMERFPPSGTLIIDEYSPDMMRGTFSGLLAESYTREQRERDIRAGVRRPLLKTVRNVQGRFWISAPWQSDDRYVSFVDEATMDSVGTDITELFRGFSTVGDGQSPTDAPSPSGDETLDLLGVIADGDPDAAALMGQCKCTCDEYEELEKFGEELERASEAEDTERFMELSQQLTTTTLCFSVCMQQYQACY
ncbi:MAG: hypothetical protein AAFS02_01825 [Pseudomonadota bacterium]